MNVEDYNCSTWNPGSESFEDALKGIIDFQENRINNK